MQTPATLHLTFSSRRPVPQIAFIRRSLRQAHAILKPPLAELSVAFVGDRVMSKLHRQFMDIDGPTDVLTFPLDEDESGRITSGEVVVCLAEARRQAIRRRIALDHELLLYILHGMLHLCGYDDLDDRSFERMHKMEDHLLTKIGIGPIFSPSSVEDD